MARAETPVLRFARHTGWALVLDEFDEMPRPVRLSSRQGQLGDVQTHVFVADEPRGVLVLLGLTVAQAQTEAFGVEGDGHVHVADHHSNVPEVARSVALGIAHQCTVTSRHQVVNPHSIAQIMYVDRAQARGRLTSGR